MIKIDLITGFLGSGKTTFIRKYAMYLKSLGEKVCILENDYGAINVDALMFDNLNIDIEMIAGGCDKDCHKRRFKTKLISLRQRKYTRVVVEPSGIYDVDEFFDTMYEDDIINFYEIGNVFCVYDINTKDLSEKDEYILVSESSNAAKLIVSKRTNKEIVDLSYINTLQKKYASERVFKESDVVYTDDINFSEILCSGYYVYDHIKLDVMDDNDYTSIYIMDKKLNLDNIYKMKKELFSNKYGKVIRIKGFVKDNNKWHSINIFEYNDEIKEVSIGQDVLIIIGENINKKLIEDYIKENI